MCLWKSVVYFCYDRCKIKSVKFIKSVSMALIQFVNIINEYDM